MGAWLPALLVFFAVVLGTLSIALAMEVTRDWFRRRSTRKRLSEVVGSAERAAASSGALIRVQDDRDSLLVSFARAFPGVTAAEDLMRQARIDLSVHTFVLLTIASAVGGGLAALMVSGSLLLAIPVAMIAAFFPYMVIARKRRVRLRNFEEQFPEAIELLTRAIRAGHPISAGMRMVADEAPAVVADEFRQAFEEQRFGMPFEDALLGMVDRLGLVDVRIFATALLIQREVGGNLAEILDNLAHTIRGRFYIRRQLRVYTAQGRISGWILGLLPIFVGGIIHLIRPEYISVMFTSLGGIALLVMAGFLQLLGILWIRSIVNIDI